MAHPQYLLSPDEYPLPQPGVSIWEEEAIPSLLENWISPLKQNLIPAMVKLLLSFHTLRLLSLHFRERYLTKIKVTCTHVIFYHGMWNGKRKEILDSCTSNISLLCDIVDRNGGTTLGTCPPLLPGYHITPYSCSEFTIIGKGCLSYMMAVTVAHLKS